MRGHIARAGSSLRDTPGGVACALPFRALEDIGADMGAEVVVAEDTPLTS
jgi:hypothetical protein